MTTARAIIKLGSWLRSSSSAWFVHTPLPTDFPQDDYKPPSPGTLNAIHTWETNTPGGPPPSVRPPPRIPARVPPPPIWRDVLAGSPIEHDLLAQLRAVPGDDHARMVYADWLESHGELGKATFVRGMPLDDRAALVARSDLAWRAITSREHVECTTERCPERWAEYTPTADERVRECPACRARVRYCADPGEATHDERVVLDLGASK